MSSEATLYWCDPEKNTECRKSGCRYVLRPCEGGVCEATFRRAFARTDENGMPMIYEKHEKWKEKKAAAAARRKEREERKNVQPVNQQSELYAQRDLQG